MATKTKQGLDDSSQKSNPMDQQFKSVQNHRAGQIGKAKQGGHAAAGGAKPKAGGGKAKRGR